MYEVEIKARLQPGQDQEIEDWLCLNYNGRFENCIYHDTYFDTRNHNLTAQEKELRLRKITGENQNCLVLTYKDPPFDSVTRSKAERQIKVDSYHETLAFIKGLGMVEDIAFEKQCNTCSINYSSYQVEISLVYVSEINERFIELEILISDAEAIREAMDALYELALLLKIDPQQVTNEYYTDLVRSARRRSGS